MQISELSKALNCTRMNNFRNYFITVEYFQLVHNSNPASSFIIEYFVATSEKN